MKPSCAYRDFFLKTVDSIVNIVQRYKPEKGGENSMKDLFVIS